eukprot:173421_1
MAAVRENVVPSRMTLGIYKEKVKAAQRGFQLLKKKSDALKARMRQLLKEILRTKLEMGEKMKNAAFSHTEATWSAGDFNDKVIDNVSSDASYRVTHVIHNIVGVRVPFFEADKDDVEDSMVGLSKGGRQIGKCKEAFTTALDDLVKLATLQTSVKALDEALRLTNRRVNALEFFVVPRLENTVKYISSEIDEGEREDMFRLKKVVANKILADEAEQEEMDEKSKHAPAPSSKSGRDVLLSDEVANMLQQYQEPVDLVIDDLDLS